MFLTHGTLTNDIKDRNSSIGQYLRTTFPNSKGLQAEYKAQAGELLVDSSGAHPGTVGTAIDLFVQITLEPEKAPEAALQLFPFNDDYRSTIYDLTQLLASSGARDVQAKAVWALALCVSAFRAGAASAPYIPSLVLGRAFSAEAMLSEASPKAIEELTALMNVASKNLLGQLEEPLAIAPTFDLTAPGDAQRIAAEADLIANGVLIDIKSNLAPKTKAGLRPDILRPEHLHQLLAYALLDQSDTFQIEHVGIYSARYGTLTTWPLQYAMDSTAGMSFDIAAGRDHLAALIQEEYSFLS